MASLADIHLALAGCLSTAGVRQVTDYPPQGVTPPVGFPRLTEWTAESFARTSVKQLAFELVVLTAQSARPQDGYRLLMEYADPAGAASIALAVWDANNRAAQSFGGLARTSAFVASFRVLGAQEMDEFQMYGGVFAVTVHTQEVA